MNMARLHGSVLVASAVVALLVGFVFYVFLIGIFERAAAIISLVIFVRIAAFAWTLPDSESNEKGS
jgi:hypothetical protein